MGNDGTSQAWRGLLSEIRQAWLSNAESTSDNDDRLLWLRWAAKFDPANWSTLQNSEGSNYFAFALPEDLRDQAAEELIKKRHVLFSAPMQCRKWITNQTCFNSEELERLWSWLWSYLQNVADWDEASLLADDDRNLFSLADAICGYIAVLVVSHRDWLRGYPDRLQWCRNRLLQIMESLRPRTYDSKGDLMDFRCDDFAAQTIVQLWVEDQDSIEIRGAVAKLALSLRYKTVALLCTQVAKLRNRLGKSWLDLESLLLRWSAARLLRDREEYRAEKTFNFENWQNQSFLPFIEGTIPAPPLTWQEIAVSEKRSRHRASVERDVEPYWPDVNMGFLLEIYGRPEHDETTWCHSRVTEQERCAFLMTSYPSPHCLDSRMVTQRDQRPPRVLRDKKAPVGRISLRRLGSLLNRYFVAGKNYHFGRNSDKAPLHRRNFRRQGFANTQPKFPFTNHFDL